jgi:beta-galactosidase
MNAIKLDAQVFLRHTILILCLLHLSATQATSQEVQTRQTLDFNDNWKFSKGNPARAQERGFNDAAWQTVELPHDWAISGPFDPQASGETGKLPWRGEGWYRKSFQWGKMVSTKRVYAVFDGVMAFPKVYVNGKLAGAWDYGYNSFYLDITDLLQPGTQNLMAVYVDTRAHDSRWYPGAGIYRKIQLVTTDPVHVGVWGTYITTPEVSDARAIVRVRTTVENKDETEMTISVRQSVLDENDMVVATDTAFCPIKAGESHSFEQFLAVFNPKRWSPETPKLYRMKTWVYRNGNLCDTYSSSFGIRTAEFTSNDGFYLNGKRYQFKGVCLHHDLGALGAAFNRRAMQRELEIMKSMGCNAIRTSHNPPAPELLDLCDELGFVVIDELFDKWEAKADYLPGADFQAFATRNATNFLHRDRNHPSIILWSVGNEIGEAQGNVNGGFEKLRILADLFRSIDPSRPITLVCDNTGAAATRHMDFYDVISFNYGRRYSLARKLAPQKSVIITESASTLSTRGFYELPLPAKAADFTDALQVSSYDLNAPYWAEIPEDDFKWQSEDTYVAGEFVWTGFDYLGEPTPYGLDAAQSGRFKLESLPRSSYFGIVDLAGMPKDRYYLYKSVWKPEENTVHILPHWNWPVKKGQNVPVFVYTNGDCAELFLNGKSLGKRCKNVSSPKSVERYRLMWLDVPYEPGVLHAVAYKEGSVIGTADVKTAGLPATIRLTPDRNRLQADGSDLSYVLCEVLDKDGNLCPLADNTLQIKVEGAGVLAGADNGNPVSHVSFQSAEQKVFNGKLMLIVQSKKEQGVIRVTVEGKGVKGGEIGLQAG